MSIWFKLGRKYLHRFLSSLSKDFNTSKEGTTIKASESRSSTMFLNFKCFSARPSIAPEKCKR